MNEETILETDDSVARYITEFFDEEELESLWENCQELNLESNPTFTLFGKPATMHRSIRFFSNESKGYKYSGQISKSKQLPSFLRKLLRRVNKAFDTEFNGILVNRYEDGNDYIGAHSDDEKGLSGGKVVGISLGSERIVRFRGKKVPLERDGKKYVDHVLENGSIFTMEGKFQKEFTHEIPKQTKIKGTRISLTFRRHEE